MSSDLFAAFGSPCEELNRQTTGHAQPEYFESPALGSQAQQDASAGGSSESQEDDDDFGDFEDASTPAATGPPPTKTQTQPSGPGSTPSSQANRNDPPTKSPTASSVPAKQVSRQEQPPDPSVGQHPFASRMDLLFDAGEDEYDAGADEMGDISSNPEAAAAYSKRLIAEQEAARIRQARSTAAPSRHATLYSLPARKEPSNSGSSSKPLPQQSEQRSPNKLKKKSGYTPQRDQNVLFDAENLSDHTGSEDEDWGDFEESTTPQPQETAPTDPRQRQEPPPTAAGLDLLSLNDESQNLTNVIHDHAKHNSTQIPADTEAVDDEPCDDFEEATQPVTKEPVDQSNDLIPWSGFMLQSIAAIGERTDNPSHRDHLPPTNVPPPLILLSVFPSYFATTRDLVFDPLSKLDSEQRTLILSGPQARKFLTGYVHLSMVMGHIIAGRKSRWKRDQHLAQGMRIGPSGGRAGMKLTGLDRTEAVKEDREALDVLRLWKAQVGKLRSTISAANAAGPGQEKLTSVPDLAEQMPIRVLKGAEGGMVAPHACALCGLKREERVAKVDVEIQDSFGEWWIDGVSMHRLCWDFWSVNRETLKSR
ncbi:hypothetical protein MBLNU230_g0172t1 [Neophaeotheca triangularis]